MIKTILQIIIFIISVLLVILCFIQANKGQNVLNGLTNNGSNLFDNQKDVGIDKTINIAIYVMVALLFILSIVAKNI
jgi:protein translocase SecG subunit